MRPQVNRAFTVNSQLPNRAVNRAFLQPAIGMHGDQIQESYIDKNKTEKKPLSRCTCTFVSDDSLTPYEYCFSSNYIFMSS